MNENPNVLNELKESVSEYNERVNAKLGALESDLDALVVENERLVIAKDGQVAEKNVCILMIAHMAEKLGYKVGTKKVSIWESDFKVTENKIEHVQYMIIADFPTGPLSWNINEADLGLFDTLSEYQGEWSGQTIEQNYSNVFTWINSQF